MIPTIIIIVAGFFWLMIETQWLTIHIPYGKPLNIPLVAMIPLIVATGIVWLAIRDAFPHGGHTLKEE